VVEVVITARDSNMDVTLIMGMCCVESFSRGCTTAPVALKEKVKNSVCEEEEVSSGDNNGQFNILFKQYSPF
jgi:hypothetical protein